MKRTRMWTSAALFAVLASFAAGCADEADLATGEADDEIIATGLTAGLATPLATPGIFISPFGPFGINACNADLTFGIRTFGTPLSFLAVDGLGLSDLSLSLFSVGANMALTPLTTFSAMPINAGLLTSIRAGLPAGLPAFLPATMLNSVLLGLSPALQADLLTLVGMPATMITNTAAMQASLALAINPAITTNALLFTGLNTLTAPLNLAIGTSFTGLGTVGLGTAGLGTAGLGTVGLGTAGLGTQLSIFAGSPLGIGRLATFGVPFGATCAGLGVGANLIAPTLPIAPIATPLLVP